MNIVIALTNLILREGRGEYTLQDNIECFYKKGV